MVLWFKAQAKELDWVGLLDLTLASCVALLVKTCQASVYTSLFFFFVKLEY